MTINFINNSAESNKGKAVIKTGQISYNTNRDVETYHKQIDFNRFENILDGYSTSFNTGTGIPVGTGGSVLFDAKLFGGSLVDLTLVNDGPNAIYLGFNNDGISIASGSELASGSSISFDGPISKIWGITSTGVSSINIFGITNYIKDTI